jgi:hypothetical protein
MLIRATASRRPYKKGMVHKRPFAGNTRNLSPVPDRSRVEVGVREPLLRSNSGR